MPSGAPRPEPVAVLDPQELLLERYGAEAGSTSRLRTAYYHLRPLMPRPVQLALRRAYTRRQRRRAFPRWPIEPVLVEHRDAQLRAHLQRRGLDELPVVATWPHGRPFAFVLTHDVEGPAGIARIGELRAIERRFGFVSSWNFCAEQYPIPAGTFDALRAEGCEIGLHGIDHRGKLFSSRARFEAALPAIHRYLAEWDAVGFRSPALHRNPEWMPELGCLYDSSFPDTDPFEPQAGGCCSVLPYFLGELVELPVTLAQDHTLWEILRVAAPSVWLPKVDWIADVGGLVNVIVHPDYVDRPERAAEYAALLEHLAGLAGGWHALPRDVAAWWRRRAELRVEPDGEGGHSVAGPDPAGAAVAYVREDAGRLVIGVRRSADVAVQELTDHAPGGQGPAPDDRRERAVQG